MPQVRYKILASHELRRRLVCKEILVAMRNSWHSDEMPCVTSAYSFDSLGIHALAICQPEVAAFGASRQVTKKEQGSSCGKGVAIYQI